MGAAGASASLQKFVVEREEINRIVNRKVRGPRDSFLPLSPSPYGKPVNIDR